MAASGSSRRTSVAPASRSAASPSVTLIEHWATIHRSRAPATPGR